MRLRKALVIGQLAFTLILLVGAGLFVQTLARLSRTRRIPEQPAADVSVNPTRERLFAVGRRARHARGATEDCRRCRMLSASRRRTPASSERRGLDDSDDPVRQALRHRWRRRRMRVGPGFSRLWVRRSSPAATSTKLTFARRGRANRAIDGHRQREFRATILRGPQSGRPSPRPRQPARHRHQHRDRRRRQGFRLSRSSRHRERDRCTFPFWDGDSDGGTFYVKMRGSGRSAFAAIRAAVARVDPALPVTLRRSTSRSNGRSRTERMLAALSSGFAVIALLLSAVGLYGVMSFVVTQPNAGDRRSPGARRDALGRRCGWSFAKGWS